MHVYTVRDSSTLERTIVTPLLLLIVVMTRTGDGLEDDDRGDVINAVRCRVRCLSVMQRTLEHELPSVYDSITLLTCLRHQECEMCLRPCNQVFTSSSHCEEACQLPNFDLPCRDSCRFLERVSVAHEGQCPSENQITATPAQCVTGCHGDTDCDRHLKCCNSNCGSTCHQPSHLFEDTPAIPDRPVIRERPKAASIELRWNHVTSNLTFGPVLYIIDSRWNIGRQENEKDMSGWQQRAQTTGTSTVISDITPGHWYQFIVTAVNINGRRGSSPPTKAFTLSKEPRRPGTPVNVTEGDTLIMGDKVAVNIHWLHPIKSHLPISRYKVFWSKKPRDGGKQSSTEFRQVVLGDQVMFQIPDLDPDSSYSVQLQAICQYGEIRLKSDKVSLSIITYPLPRTETHVAIGSRTLNPPNTVRSLPTPPTPLQLNSHRSFYHNGVLKANISWTLPELDDDGGGHPEIDRIFVFWSPEACIADRKPEDGLAKVKSGSTQENFFVVYDLRFDCRYLIRVQPVSNQGVLGVTRHLILATPACYETSVVGHVKPDCPNSASRLPDEPKNFQHSFFISSSNITARLIWDDPPSHSPSIFGYRVIWGQMPQTALLLDSSSTLTKVLSRESRSFELTGLHEGTTYSARLQALSKAGAGRGVALLFTTPLLHVSSPPRDSDLHEKEEDDDDNDVEDGKDYDDDDYDTSDTMIQVLDSGHQASIRQVAPINASSDATSVRSLLLAQFLTILFVLHSAIQHLFCLN